MKKIHFVLLLSVFAAIILVGCLAYVPPPPLDGVYAPGPPPEPLVDVVPVVPFPGAVWVGGLLGLGFHRLGVESRLLGASSPSGRGVGTGALAPLSPGLWLASGALAIRVLPGGVSRRAGTGACPYGVLKAHSLLPMKLLRVVTRMATSWDNTLCQCNPSIKTQSRAMLTP